MKINEFILFILLFAMGMIGYLVGYRVFHTDKIITMPSPYIKNFFPTEMRVYKAENFEADSVVDYYNVEQYGWDGDTIKWKFINQYERRIEVKLY